MPINSVATASASKNTSSVAALAQPAARSPKRDGMPGPAPASNSANLDKKRKAANKTIRANMAGIQNQITEVSKEIVALEATLRAVHYTKTGTHKEVLALLGQLIEKHDSLKPLFKELPRVIADSMKDFDAVISDNMRHELNETSSATEIETQYSTQKRHAHSALLLGLIAFKREDHPRLSKLRESMRNSRRIMDSMKTLAQLEYRRELKRNYDNHLPELLEHGGKWSKAYLTAAHTLAAKNVRGVELVKPQGLPQEIDVVDSDALFQVLHEQGKHFRQALVEELEAKVRIASTIVGTVAPLVSAGRKKYNAAETITPELLVNYLSPHRAFLRMAQKQESVFTAIEEGPAFLKNQITILERRADDAELRELQHLQNLLLTISQANIQCSLFHMELMLHSPDLYNDETKKNARYSSADLQNRRGLLIAVQNISDLQELYEKSLKFKDNFPEDLSKRDLEEIYPRLQLLNDAMGQAKERVDMLIRDAVDAGSEEADNSGITLVALRRISHALDTAKDLVVDKLGKIARTGFQPGHKTLTTLAKSDPGLEKLRATLAQIGEKWDLTLPRATLQTDEDDLEDIEDDHAIGPNETPGQRAVPAAAENAGDDATVMKQGGSESSAQGGPAGAAGSTTLSLTRSQAGQPADETLAADALVEPAARLDIAPAAAVEAPLTATEKRARKLLLKARQLSQIELPEQLQVARRGVDRNKGHARTILQQLENKDQLADLNPGNINEFYKRAANDLVDLQANLRSAARKWQAVETGSPDDARESQDQQQAISRQLSELDDEIADLRAEGLRKTANGYAFKPSKKGMAFLFDQDFIDLVSPPIKPYYVKAYRTTLDPAQTDPDKRWVTVEDDKGNALEDSYQVFGIQIKPDPSDLDANGKNRMNYQVFMHAMLDENRPEASSDDGRFFHPDSSLRYTQYKWKRGDEHKRGKMWLDREEMAMPRQSNGRGVQINAEVYRNFSDRQSFMDCVPRYLKIAGDESLELEEVDLRKLQRKGKA